LTQRRAVLPATAELMERIGWFIRLRWVAIVGVAVFVETGRRVLPVDFHLAHVLSTVALLALYNALATLYYRGLSGLSDRGPDGPGSMDGPGPAVARWMLPRTLRTMGYDPALVRAVYFVNVQMILDLGFLAALLHFTGGIENPLRMFFIFHVIIAGILLSRRATYFFATVALLFMAGVALGELAGFLPHYSLNAHWRPGGYLDLHLTLTQLFLLGTTLFITAYMGSSIGARLRTKELDVVILSEELDEKAERLKALLTQVRGAERVKSQYMRKVAHEIRGPLGTIQSALAVVLRRDGDLIEGEAKELIRRAERRAGELAEMTRELLALSRARDGTALSESARLRPVEIASRVLEEMMPRARESGVSLQVDLDSSIPEMEADPEGLIDLLTNLIGNAIRYTPAGGRVDFRMRKEGGELLLEVADTGIGIEEAVRGRIFEEFFRSESARALVPDGTGLGLAIVKAVIDQHGGTVALDSEVGKGTRFEVRLPLGEADHVPGSRPAGPEG